MWHPPRPASTWTPCCAWARPSKKRHALTADQDGLACAKLCVFANIPQDVPFMAGAYLGVGEPDAVINVGVSGPGVVRKAVDRASRIKSRS
jgi:uncharacterized protein (UPF0210 family)